MTVRETLREYKRCNISTVILVDETNHRHVFHSIRAVPESFYDRVISTSFTNDAITGYVLTIYMTDQCSTRIDPPEFKTVQLVDLTPETIDAIADAIVKKIREERK